LNASLWVRLGLKSDTWDLNVLVGADLDEEIVDLLRRKFELDIDLLVPVHQCPESHFRGYRRFGRLGALGPEPLEQFAIGQPGRRPRREKSSQLSECRSWFSVRHGIWPFSRVPCDYHYCYAGSLGLGPDSSQGECLSAPSSTQYDDLSYWRRFMATTKVAISLDSKLLERLDRLVAERVFRNRSQAVQDAIRDKLDRLAHTRLARECAKLDVQAERELADEGLAKDATGWPEY
jgi:Arc/MetJ-type ribon-helix-helix transcriptional regulator